MWIRWGYGLPVLGKSVIALATIWPLVLGGRLLDRFGKGLRGAPRDALIADAVTSDQRGRAFGLHRALDTAGALTGVLVSALLLWWLTRSPHQISGAATNAAETSAWVYREIFGIAAVPGLGSLILTFFVRASDSAPGEAETTREPVSEVTDDASTSPAQNGPFNLPVAYWLVLGLLTLFSLANSSDTFLLLRVRDLGYSPWMVVLVYGVYNLTYSALSFPMGALSDRRGRWPVIAAGWMIYAGVYTGFALLPVSQGWGVWPLMALYGVFMALTDGVGKALISDHVPAQSRGAAMGLFYAITGVTTLAASVLAGLLWDRSGPTAAFLLGAGSAILALIAMIPIRRRVV